MAILVAHVGTRSARAQHSGFGWRADTCTHSARQVNAQSRMLCRTLRTFVHRMPGALHNHLLCSMSQLQRTAKHSTQKCETCIAQLQRTVTTLAQSLCQSVDCGGGGRGVSTTGDSCDGSDGVARNRACECVHKLRRVRDQRGRKRHARGYNGPAPHRDFCSDLHSAHSVKTMSRRQLNAYKHHDGGCSSSLDRPSVDLSICCSAAHL